MSICVEQNNFKNNQLPKSFNDTERSLFYAHFKPKKPIVFQLFKIWLNRSKQRRGLAKLDKRLLADIGYSVEQAIDEYNKPFWK